VCYLNKLSDSVKLSAILHFGFEFCCRRHLTGKQKFIYVHVQGVASK